MTAEIAARSPGLTSLLDERHLGEQAPLGAARIVCQPDSTSNTMSARGSE
jgi:hypothetical protein